MHYFKALKTLKQSLNQPLKQRLAIFLITPLLAFLPASYAVAETEETETEETAIKQRVLPNIALKRSQSLLEHMRLFDREDEVITLETTIFTSAGADENSQGKTEKESFYGLFLEEESGNPQGAILILHDNQQHGHWPEVIAPIREYLPQFGWATLAIELPDSPARTRPPRKITEPAMPKENSNENTEEDSENTEEADNDTAGDQSENEEPADSTGAEGSTSLETETEKDAEPALPRLQKLPALAEDNTKEATTESDKKLSPKIIFQQQNANRILAAVNHLKSLNQLNLVILGHGTGAAWAIDYIQKQDKDSPQATTGLTLITIDALTSQLTPQKMHEQIKDIKVPYLDLIHPEQTRAAQLAKKRLRILKRIQTANHQQFITPAMSGYGDVESPTSRRIRGWLMNNAAGSLVKAAAK